MNGHTVQKRLDGRKGSGKLLDGVLSMNRSTINHQSAFSSPVVLASLGRKPRLRVMVNAGKFRAVACSATRNEAAFAALICVLNIVDGNQDA